MEVIKDSAHKLGRYMRQLDASKDDAIVMGLLLEIEEGFQLFFSWLQSLDHTPTIEECLEIGMGIRGALEDRGLIQSEDDDAEY